MFRVAVKNKRLEIKDIYVQECLIAHVLKHNNFHFIRQNENEIKGMNFKISF